MTELGKPGGFDPEAEQKAIESTVVGITEISMSRLGKDHPKQAEARLLTAIGNRVEPMIRETRESARQAENPYYKEKFLKPKKHLNALY